jgi:hypothetical protein
MWHKVIPAFVAVQPSVAQSTVSENSNLDFQRYRIMPKTFSAKVLSPARHHTGYERPFLVEDGKSVSFILTNRIQDNRLSQIFSQFLSKIIFFENFMISLTLGTDPQTKP